MRLDPIASDFLGLGDEMPSSQYRAPQNPPPCPPGHEYVFVQQANTPEQSVTKITVPAVIAVAGAITLITLTYTITTHMNDLKNGIELIKGKLDTVTNTVYQKISDLESEIDKKTQDRWTKRDQEYWCREAAVVNKGWACPGTGNQLLRFQPAPTTGWDIK